MFYHPMRGVVALIVGLLGLESFPVAAQRPDPEPTAYGGPVAAQPMDKASIQIDLLHPQSLANAQRLGLPAGVISKQGDGIFDRSTWTKFNFPMRVKPASTASSPMSISNFFDLDGTTALGDWACGQRTYDGHRGIDFSLPVLSWHRMDQSEVEIVAVAPGTIVNRTDGQYDRNCATSVAALPSGQVANFVAIRHDDGATAYYLHMKSGSVTAKAVGARVVTGEKLGTVGSSGHSTGPHLHFEIRDEQGVAVDPFAGTCGATRSLWKHQWNANDDFRLIQAATFGAVPTFASNCSNFQQLDTDVVDFKNTFSPGEVVRPVVMLRDQSPGKTAAIQLFDPSGTQMFSSVSGTAPTGSYYKSAYWYWNYTLPASAAAGTWRVRATVSATNVVEHNFFVGNAPPTANIFAALLPGGRSVQTSAAATVFATILNASSTAAKGCMIQPQTPVASGFSFQTTDPATNQLTGTINKSVDIPANASQSFVIAFNPVLTGKAEAVTTILRMKCANSDAAPIYEGVNTLLLSFDQAPIPDIIPIAATPTNDGVVRLPGASGSGFWAAASVNIGVSASLSVTPNVTGGAAVRATICETNATTGACLATPTATTTTTFATNAVHTFAVFVTALGAVPFDPAGSRISLDFNDASGITRGQTSVAITTN